MKILIGILIVVFFLSFNPVAEALAYGEPNFRDYFIATLLLGGGLFVFAFICVAAYDAIFSVLDLREGVTHVAKAVVLEVRHEGQTNTPSVMPIAVPNGNGGMNMSVIPTTYTTPERYVLIARITDSLNAALKNKVVEVECNLQEFYDYKSASVINLDVCVGGLTGGIVEAKIKVS
jgi:hypothetical protein